MKITHEIRTPASPIILVTGAMAAGKSSVAQAIAERLEPSVHLRGDVFRRMVVNGRIEMSAEPSEEALRQLMLRYEAAYGTAALYSRAGFNVVYQDTIVGPVLADVVALYRDLPLHVVVLCPREEVISQREKSRGKTGYGSIAIGQLQQALRETPGIGFWLDNSDQTVAETADAVLANLAEARVGEER